MPMSASCMVNRGEMLALLDEVRALLPEELAHAEQLLARPRSGDRRGPRGGGPDHRRRARRAEAARVAVRGRPDRRARGRPDPRPRPRTRRASMRRRGRRLRRRQAGQLRGRAQQDAQLRSTAVGRSCVGARTSAGWATSRRTTRLCPADAGPAREALASAGEAASGTLIAFPLHRPRRSQTCAPPAKRPPSTPVLRSCSIRPS